MRPYISGLIVAVVLLIILLRFTGLAKTGSSATAPSIVSAFNAMARDYTPSPLATDRFNLIVTKLENEGKLPKLDRSNTVAGIDADGNGVRDDIDVYIAQRFTEPLERAAVTQYARGYQAFLLTDTDDIDDVLEANRIRRIASACVFYRFKRWKDTSAFNSPFTIVADIGALTRNTKARLHAELHMQQALNGQGWTHIRGNTCDD
jgi:hypothetical protein